MIGQTPEEVRARARRDKDTVAIENNKWLNMPAVIVRYQDGSTITHVFDGGKEHSFLLTSKKRLSSNDVSKIQRLYHIEWYGTGTKDGIYSWRSVNELLTMIACRYPGYDYLGIFKDAQPRPSTRTEEETATYPPPQRPFVPTPAPVLPKTPSEGSDSSSTGIAQTRPESSGTGFFITDDGYLITNEHVAGNGAQVRLVTSAGLISAKVVKVDAANDLALLKAEGKFAVLPVAASRSMKLGGTVATVGFPNIGLQGFAPKFARGEIGSLSGLKDDARCFQISVPVQPGNSGGALVDERGNVVGVVSGKLSAKATLNTSGSLPENVNYAVKSSFLLGFLESVPEVAAKLKEPNANDTKFDDMVERAKEAAVLVLVY
jgi:S1-C subfamily serine protease